MHAIAREYRLSRDDENKVGTSGRVGVFQLTGNIHYFDSDQFFPFIIEDDQIVDIALTVTRLRFLFETDVWRIHVILIIKPQFTGGRLTRRRAALSNSSLPGVIIPPGSLCAIDF